MNEQNNINQVSTYLSLWAQQISLNHYVSLADIDKIAVGLTAKLLNITENLNLQRPIQTEPAQTGIDLGDEVAGIAFYVTSKVDTDKLITITRAFFKEYAHIYKKGIRFLLLSDEDEKIKRLKEAKRLRQINPRFNPREHLVSLKDITRKSVFLFDQDRPRFEALLVLLEKELGALKPTTRLLTPLPRLRADMKLKGRQMDLDQLYKHLRLKNQLLVMNGLAGSGKTELCKRFFLDHYEKYGNAAWVEYQGSLNLSLRAALEKNFPLLPEGEDMSPLDRVMEGLHQLGKDLLVVVDNILDLKDADLPLLLSLPATVLVNSPHILQGFSLYRLDVLPETASLELFSYFYRGQTESEDESVVKTLVNLCNGHPLAIEWLANRARNAGLSLVNFLQWLHAKGFDLRQMGKKGGPIASHDKGNLNLFYDHLLTLLDISGLTAQEEEVAMNMSLLPSSFIPRQEVQTLLKLESLEGVEGLLSKGWLRVEDGSGDVIMHEVARFLFRLKTKPDALKCGILIDTVDSRLTENPGDTMLEKMGSAIWVTELLCTIGGGSQKLASLAEKVAWIYDELGYKFEALDAQKRCVTILEGVVAGNHPLLAVAYGDLSRLYQRQGRLQEALVWQEKALKIREMVLAPDHEDLAQSYHNLSVLYMCLLRMSDALHFCKKAVDILRKNHPHGHPNLELAEENLPFIEKMVAVQELQKLG